MLSGPSVLSALGLYDVAVGSGSMYGDSAWHVCIGFIGGEQQYVLTRM